MSVAFGDTSAEAIGRPPTLRTLPAMNLERRDIDWLAFSLALAALAAISGAFIAQRNGAAAVMCAICLAALVLGRLIGIPGRVLLPVALGLAVLLYVVWIADLPISPRKVTSAAHATGGLLVGWAFAELLRRRIDWPGWAVAALAAVFALTVTWEIGEMIGDRLLDTGLIPDRRDSAFDIAFGCLGASVSIAAVALFSRRR